MNGSPTDLPHYTCGCGKVAYHSRADARRARRLLRGGGHLNAYRCEHVGDGRDVWHLGTLPAPVADGRIPRSKAVQQVRPPSPQRRNR